MKKRSYKFTNDIIEDHGDYLIVDISTPKHPVATMAVDADIWERREGGRVHAFKNARHKYICAMHIIDGKDKYFHHQVIAKADGLEIDHIVHGSTTFVDNRRSNLRVATGSQNQMNTSIRSNNTSGIVGVSWNKPSGKWQSHIRIDGKRKHLGYFDNLEIAIGARQQAERELFGEYAFNNGATK